MLCKNRSVIDVKTTGNLFSSGKNCAGQILSVLSPLSVSNWLMSSITYSPPGIKYLNNSAREVCWWGEYHSTRYTEKWQSNSRILPTTVIHVVSCTYFLHPELNPANGNYQFQKFLIGLFWIFYRISLKFMLKHKFWWKKFYFLYYKYIYIYKCFKLTKLE